MLQSSSRINVRIEDGHIAISHASRDEKFINLHQLPNTPMTISSPCPIAILDDPIQSYRVRLPNAADARVSFMAKQYRESYFALLGFDDATQLCCARVQLATSSRKSVTPVVHTLPQPLMTSAEVISVGADRAVWLERNWEEDEMRLMKLWWTTIRRTEPDGTTIEEVVPRVGELLPPYPELPLRPSECRSLSFDEVTGRLCLGTLGGGWFLLDFAPAHK
jgi:hypothetical protein